MKTIRLRMHLIIQETNNRVYLDYELFDTHSYRRISGLQMDLAIRQYLYRELLFMMYCPPSRNLAKYIIHDLPKLYKYFEKL
jgi:hypothetical protein